MAAVLEVRNSKMGLRAAARHFNLPVTTLADHVHGRVQNFKTPGHERELPDDVEKALVDYVIYMSRQNFPLRRSDVRAIVMVSLDMCRCGLILYQRFHSIIDLQISPEQEEMIIKT